MYDGQTYVVMFVTQYKERQAIPDCALRGKGCTLFFVAHASQKIHCSLLNRSDCLAHKTSSVLLSATVGRTTSDCLRFALQTKKESRNSLNPHLLPKILLNRPL